MIVAQNLSKFYGNHKAIDDVSFEIAEGEIVGLLGLNGAGKSTILKVLGTFLVPSGGVATVNGFSIHQDPMAIRKMIGYLPDTPPLYDEMTVTGYLEFVGKLKNVEGNRLKSRIAEVMEQTSVREVQDFRLGELSHGFRQRVGIAQALIHEPKVLILDEPINGLDPMQIVEMRDMILSLKGKHTVILSSHILSEITQTCDRVLVIDRGQLVAEGAESALHRRVSESMELEVEVQAGSSDLTNALQRVEGVSSIKTLNEAGPTTRLTVQTNRDVRKEIAEQVVASGAGLVGLTRKEEGLEGVFMKLVQGSEDRHG